MPFLPNKQFPLELLKGENKNSLKPLSVALIAGFKSENLRYQNEAWYKKIILDLMNYDEFRNLWPQITQDDYPKKLLDYEYKRVIGVFKSKKLFIDFHLFTAKVIGDPRFQIVFYYPADRKTQKHCSKVQEVITSSHNI